MRNTVIRCSLSKTVFRKSDAAFQAIIPSSQQSAVFSDSPAIILVLSTADPKTHCSGSAGALPALSGPETQYAAVLLASLTLYVVSLPCPEIGRSAPEKGGVVIP